MPMARIMTPRMSVKIPEIRSMTLPSPRTALVYVDKDVNRKPSIAAESITVPIKAVAKLRTINPGVPMTKRAAL
jgi:hypothetical protein